MSRDESEQLARHIGDLSATSLPLAEGLRAAAEEAGSRALAAALRDLAARIESGVSPEEALRALQTRMPSHVRGLVAAAVRSGQLGQTLSHLIEHRRSARELRREIFAALTYPGLLLAMTLGVFVVFMLLVVPGFRSMFLEIGLELPTTTKVLFWWSETGVWLLLGLLVTLPTLAIVARLALGAARWKRLTSAMPILGPLWHWMGVAQMTRLLGVLIQQQVPLPEALRLAADGTADANVREVCHAMAKGAEQGRGLSEMISTGFRLPMAMVPLVRWGERSDSLAEALRTSSEMFESRVRLRASLLKSVLPPFIFVFVALTSIFMIFGSLYGPMKGMITGLFY